MTSNQISRPPVSMIESKTNDTSPWVWRMLAVVLLGFLFSALTGCGIFSRNAEISTWIGRPMNELVQSRGNPTSWERDGKGNRVLVYEWTWESTYETPGRAWRDASGVRWTNPKTETILHRERRAYYVNRDGIVFDGKWAW